MELSPQSNSERPRRIKWGRVLIFLLIAFCLMVVWRKKGSEDRLQELRKSGFPIAAAELTQWPMPVADERNAALKLKKAIDLLVAPSNGYPSISLQPEHVFPKKREEVRKILESNRAALELIHEAAQLPQSRWPVDWSKGFDVMLPDLAHIKQMTQLLHLSIQWHVAEGDLEWAVGNYLDALGVCRSVVNEPVLISQLVRIACFAISNEALGRLVAEQKLSDEQLIRIQDALADLESKSGNCFRNSLVGERCLGIDFFFASIPKQAALMTFSPSGASTNAPAKMVLYVGASRLLGLQDIDFAFYRKEMDAMLEACRLTYPERLVRIAEERQQTDRHFSSWKKIVTPFSNMLFPALNKAAIRDAADLARVRAARVAVTVERYRMKHEGQLPQTLEELAPEFPEAMLEDPFTGKPLHYLQTASGYRVYSVGENKLDNQGDPRLDVTFAVEK